MFTGLENFKCISWISRSRADFSVSITFTWDEFKKNDDVEDKTAMNFVYGRGRTNVTIVLTNPCHQLSPLVNIS